MDNIEPQLDVIDVLVNNQNDETSQIYSVPKEPQHDQYFTELIQGTTAVEHSRQLPDHMIGPIEYNTLQLPVRSNTHEVTEYIMNKNETTLFPVIGDHESSVHASEN